MLSGLLPTSHMHVCVWCVCNKSALPFNLQSQLFLHKAPPPTSQMMCVYLCIKRVLHQLRPDTMWRLGIYLRLKVKRSAACFTHMHI